MTRAAADWSRTRSAADLVEHRLAPVAAARARRAAVVHARDDVALLREHQVPEPAAAAVCVAHRLVRRLAVHVEQHRILLRRVEVGRLHHPRVELDAAADVDLQELDRPLLECRELRLERVVVDERARDLVRRQPHQVGRPAACPTTTPCESRSARRGRCRSRACPRAAGGRRAARGSPPVEPDAPEEHLRRVLGRRVEVEPAALRIDVRDLHHVVLAVRDEPHRAVARHEVRVPPAVALAQVDERRAVVEPVQRRARAPVVVVVVDVDPRAVALDEQRLRARRSRASATNIVFTRLPPVELLDRAARSSSPPSPCARDSCCADRRESSSTSSGRRSRSRRRCAPRSWSCPPSGYCTGIGERVERVGVVDQQEVAHAARVELPVGDALAVRAPAEPVAHAQLFLVHPVERAVDDRLRAVAS